MLIEWESEVSYRLTSQLSYGQCGHPARITEWKEREVRNVTNRADLAISSSALFGPICLESISIFRSVQIGLHSCMLIQAQCLQMYDKMNI